jgi:hypothetical protein
MNLTSEPENGILRSLRQQLASSAAKTAALERELTKPGSIYGGEPVADVIFGVARGFSLANRALMLGLGQDGSDRYSVNACQAQLPVVFSSRAGYLLVTPVAPDSTIDKNRIGLITLDLALTPPATPTGGVASVYQSVSIPGDGNGWQPDDPNRMLRHDGGGNWTGTMWLGTEAYKFAANGSWTINWGKGGKQNGDNFDRLVSPGWYAITWDENNPGSPLLVLVDGSTGPCSATFFCEKGYTIYGQSVYVIGSIPELGSWDPANAIALAPEHFPSWVGKVAGLPANTRFEWKFIIREESGSKRVIAWEPGNNHHATTGMSGEGETLRGTLG